MLFRLAVIAIGLAALWFVAGLFLVDRFVLQTPPHSAAPATVATLNYVRYGPAVLALLLPIALLVAVGVRTRRRP